MHYDSVHVELLRAVPELRPAFDRLLVENDGELPGQYIVFEDLLRPYTSMLLSVPQAGFRDEALNRIFNLLERMLEDGGEIENLAFISVLEHQPSAWLQAAKPFLGRRAEAALDEFDVGWRKKAVQDASRYSYSHADNYGLLRVAQSVASSGA